MSCRAIHVELTNTLSTESFLLAYQRFTSVRGHPQKIWSDPGMNFIGAKPVLEEMYTYLSQQNKKSLEEEMGLPKLLSRSPKELSKVLVEEKALPSVNS